MNPLFPYIQIDSTGHGVAVSGQHTARLGYHLMYSDGHDDGLFAEWDWDGRRLEARVDWLGVHPLFYGEHRGRVVVSNNILPILEAGIPADLDRGALGAFFRLGFMLDCDTPFKHIRAFPPGGRLVLENGKLTLTEKYLEAPLVEGITRNQEKEAYIELTRQAIARRTPLHGEFIQPLSGGRDSRHIVAELARQRCQPRYCYTIETIGRTSPGSEESIAATVAARLGFDHRILRHPVRSEIQRELLKNALTSFAANEGAWMLGAIDDLSRCPEAIYDGFLGDVLSAFHWSTAPGFLEAYCDQGAIGLVEAVLRRFCPRKWAVETALTEVFGASPEFSDDYCRSRMGAFLRKFTHLHNPVTHFMIFSRGRREIAMSTWGCYPFLGKILAPFLDRDFFLYYLGLPERIELPYGFTRGQAIEAAFPQLRGIPYAMSPRMGKISLTTRRMALLSDLVGRSFAMYACPTRSLWPWVGRSLAVSGNKSTPDLNSHIYLQQVKGLGAHAAGRLLKETTRIFSSSGIAE